MSTSALQILDPSQPHQFIRPIKRINEVHDVSHFLTSRAYAELVTFLFQLNVAVFPRRIQDSPSRIQRFEAGSADNGLSDTVQWLRELLHKLEAIIDEAPPDAGPRRFGNVSFRKWYGIVEERASDLLDEHVPQSVLSRQSVSTKDEGDEKTEQRQDVNAKDEIMGYFIGSFGSAQRLDYGTGHELSFLAFLAAIWKLGGFRHDNVEAGEEERGIVLGVIDPCVFLSFSSCYSFHMSFALTYANQISKARPPPHQNLQPRTRGLPWGLGTRRPLLFAVHLWFRAILPRHHLRSRRASLGRIHPGCTTPTVHRRPNHRQLSKATKHVFRRYCIHHGCQDGSILGT